jgi:hypothetical protein
MISKKLSGMHLFYRYLMPAVCLSLLLQYCSKEKPEAAAGSEDYTEAAAEVPAEDSTRVIIHFTDITASAGIKFEHENGAFGKKWMPETIGSGAGFFDYNNDGRTDLFLVNSCYWNGHEKQGAPPVQKLYQNLGNNRFRDVTAGLGLDMTLYGMGCAFADYDADGDMDIYITAVGTNRLLRNDGSGFTDVTVAAGVAGNSEHPAWSTGAAWFDADRDGWLDLFVCNYVKWTPDTDLFTTLDGKTKTYATPQPYQGESCRLYRNIHGKYFQDISRAAGIFNPQGKSLSVAVDDLNDDGWPDLVISNDTQPNFLYMNNGDGTFTDKALQAGVAFDEFGRARAGMGVDITDISNNGHFSIAIGNFTREPISLFTMVNPSTFQDFSGRAHISKASLMSLTFGLLFRDIDLDGYQDMVITNGHIEPEINKIQREITFRQPAQLFRNTGHGRFIEVTEQAGTSFAKPIVGRGLAAADIDNDGDFDLVITQNHAPALLFRNDLSDADNHWIKFRLKGISPNLNAVGAKISIWTGSNKQTGMIRTGSSYLSQSDISEIIFGLGRSARVDSIQIRWPTTGKISRLGAGEAGKIYTIKEKEPALVLE